MFPDKRHLILVLLFAGMVFLYGSLCFVVLQNSRFVVQISKMTLTNDFVEKALNQTSLHDAEFFRKAGDKLQRSAHDPQLVQKAFRLATIKGPGSHANFLSYAVFAATQKCCRENAPVLFQEALKRNPLETKIYQTAGSSMLALNLKEEAYSYFNRALKINSTPAHEIYRVVERHGGTIRDFYSITPRNTESMLLLGSYLAFHDPPAVETQSLLRELAKMPMEQDQRVQLARTAFRVGDLGIARTQVLRVLEERPGRIDALQILAEVYEREKKWPEYEKVASIIEEAYTENEANEKAAAFALNTVRTLVHVESKQKSEERLKRMIRSYPTYAPAFFELSTLQTKTEPEKSLINLQKALRLDPENFVYGSRLAAQYLELYMVSRAEEVYLRFSQIPRFRDEAYVGLSLCKQMAGKNHEAIVLLQEALDNGGKSTRLLRELGRNYYQIGNYHKAAETYEEYAAMMPQKPTGYLLAGEMYTRAGERTAAKEQYQLALEVDPKNREARQALSRLNESSQ